MTPQLILGVTAAYFLMLIVISWLTSRKSSNSTFFTGNRKSPWFLVAFGMIGASLSGVTFMSVPGWVAAQQFSYMEMVLGYLAGYLFISFILLPIYYKLKAVSIYDYLRTRFGVSSYKTGAAFFLLSRIIGASFRLYLVAGVLQIFVFGRIEGLHLPFAATVAITIGLIWLYTFRGGIKTIVWTDAIQTFFMLVAMGLAVYFISDELNWSFGTMVAEISSGPYSRIFVFDDWKSGNFFFKQFLSGALITIVMTGLDQDMMQKNLSIPTLAKARKNIYVQMPLFVIVNLCFLSLGALLFHYVIIQHGGGDFSTSLPNETLIGMADQVGLRTQDYLHSNGNFKTDFLFPLVALEYMPIMLGLAFTIGLIAAAYSSADSALTALTTSVCVDFLNQDEQASNKKLRYMVHGIISAILLVVIVIFHAVGDDSVIGLLFKAATYTYGPLLGLFFFGIFTSRNVKDKFVPIVAIICPVICFIVNYNSKKWFGGYNFGYEMLAVNGILTFLGLWLISDKSKSTS